MTFSVNFLTTFSSIFWRLFQSIFLRLSPINFQAAFRRRFRQFSPNFFRSIFRQHFHQFFGEFCDKTRPENLTQIPETGPAGPTSRKVTEKIFCITSLESGLPYLHALNSTIKVIILKAEHSLLIDIQI